MFTLFRMIRGERYLRWPKVVEENAAALQMQMTVEEAGIAGEMGGGSVFHMFDEKLREACPYLFVEPSLRCRDAAAAHHALPPCNGAC